MGKALKSVHEVDFKSAGFASIGEQFEVENQNQAGIEVGRCLSQNGYQIRTRCLADPLVLNQAYFTWSVSLMDVVVEVCCL